MNRIDIQENINSVNDRITHMQQELWRLEGSLRVFQQLRDAGLAVIPLGDQPDVFAENEVINTIPDRRNPNPETPDEISETSAR